MQIAAEKIFYLKLGKGDATRKLYMREGFSGAERLLVDPLKGVAKREQFSIDYFRASPNGMHVAYGISVGGNEECVLRVLETAKGTDLGVAIVGARYGEAVSWSPDGKSFFTISCLRLKAASWAMSTASPTAMCWERMRSVTRRCLDVG